MEQVSEELNNFDISEAKKSLVDDSDCPASDDKEYATSGFYVREKTSDKEESETNSSSNSNDLTENDKEEPVKNVTLVNGETSKEKIMEVDNETEEKVIEDDKEIIEEKDVDEIEEKGENSEEAEIEDKIESAKDKIEDGEGDEIDKEKTEEKQVEEIVDELKEATTNEGTSLEATGEPAIDESKKNDEEESSKEDEEKASKEVEEVEATKEEEGKNSKKDEDGSSSKHSSSTNTASDEEDEDDFDPSLLCPDISMDIDEAPVVTNSQPPPVPRDSSLSPLPYEPIFSTLVDEYTGTEIQVDLTPEEAELRQNMYKISNPVQSTKIHCTACNVHLGSALIGANNRFVHPLLKVLICKNCYHFYTSGEFEKDEDGSELYCRWCGQGGQVLCCSSCEFVFCKRCIRNNFGPKKFKQIRESDDWSCFRCEPGQLSYLRAACAEFMDYYKKESRRVHALGGSNPELMTLDYTKCCSKEKAEEGKAPAQRAKRRRNNNEDSDPDYNVHDGGEPSSKRQHLSVGGSTVGNQLRPLAPKPSTTTSIVAPGHPKSILRPQLAVKTEPVRIRQLGNNSAIRNVAPPGFVARPGVIKLVQRQPRPVAPPQLPRPSLSYTVVSGTTNGRPALNSIRPPATAKVANQIPPMKHEWFEKTVRAAARVNSNLSYTLTQLNRQQSQANSVESLAVVHNKLQEVLSTSINSLIQVRKNLRTEFLVGIKSVKLPPKTPKPTVVPPPKAARLDDDDVIFVSQPPPLVMSPSVNKKLPLKAGVVNNMNKTLTVKARPVASTSGAPKIVAKPALKKTPPPPTSNIGGPVKGGGFLKVRSLMALQSVPSECITIPDDPVEDPLKLTPPMLPMLPMPDDRIEILDDDLDKNESPVVVVSSPPPLAKISRRSPSLDMEMTYDLSGDLSPEVRKMMKVHVPLDKSPYLEQLLEKDRENEEMEEGSCS